MVAFDSQDVVPTEAVKTVAVQSDGIRAGEVKLSTYSTASFAEKKRAFIALDSAESVDASKMLDVPIVLTDYALIGAEFVNEQTGVIESTTRVVLTDDQNRSFYAFSDTLARSVEQLHHAFGDPRSWEEPLSVAVVEGRSNKGHKFFKIALQD